MDGIANYFLAQNALDCRIFSHIHSQIFSRGGVIPPGPRRNAPVLAPRHQFLLVSPAFPMFHFYETTTGHFFTDRPPCFFGGSFVYLQVNVYDFGVSE